MYQQGNWAFSNEEFLNENQRKKEIWEKTKKEIEDLNREVLDLAKEKMGRNSVLWVHNKKLEFQKIIKKEAEINNLEDYVAWHRIIGSSVDMSKAPKLDFPNPYSVKEFLINLKEEINNFDKDWEKKAREIKILLNNVIKLSREKIGTDWHLWIDKKNSEFRERLEKLGFTPEIYAAWQLMTKGEVDTSEGITGEDFPEPNSTTTFLKNLIQELREK
jgi:hypothetical protein